MHLSFFYRNGGTDRSPLVGTFCGTDIPKTIRSHANQLYLHFLSDSSINYRGFELRWDASSSGCGGIISESPRGTITSPNYPGAYGEHLQCDWRITVAKGSTIHVIFADIDMETVLDCFFDSVEVSQIGDICSSRVLNIWSHLHICSCMTAEVRLTSTLPHCAKTMDK